MPLWDWPDCDDDDELDNVGRIGPISSDNLPKLCEICRTSIGHSCQHCGTVICGSCRDRHQCSDD